MAAQKFLRSSSAKQWFEQLAQKKKKNALDRFSAACDQAGMKISSETEVFCLYRNPSQGVLQVSGNATQQMEQFKYLGVAFTSDEIIFLPLYFSTENNPF